MKEQLLLKIWDQSEAISFRYLQRMAQGTSIKALVKHGSYFRHQKLADGRRYGGQTGSIDRLKN